MTDLPLGLEQCSPWVDGLIKDIKRYGATDDNQLISFCFEAIPGYAKQSRHNGIPRESIIQIPP
jgi:hypothetical protein